MQFRCNRAQQLSRLASWPVFAGKIDRAVALAVYSPKYTYYEVVLVTLVAYEVFSNSAPLQ